MNSLPQATTIPICHYDLTHTPTSQLRPILPIIPTPPLDNVKGSTAPPKHTPQIPRQQLRLLMRIKVTAAHLNIIRLEHHVAQRPPPRLRQHAQFLGVMRESQLDPPNIRFRIVPRDRLRSRHRVHDLVVNAHRGRGTGAREIIHRHPGEDLVVGPRIRVGPIVQLLVDPREQGDGRIVEAVRERLGLGRLLEKVAAALFGEPFRAREAVVLGAGVGRRGVLEREDRVLREARLLAADHVDVACFALGVGG